MSGFWENDANEVVPGCTTSWRQFFNPLPRVRSTSQYPP